MSDSTQRDCYFSPLQWELMKALGCRMRVTLNGSLVSFMVEHGGYHTAVHEDEVFVGTAALADIECVEYDRPLLSNE